MLHFPAIAQKLLLVILAAHSQVSAARPLAINWLLAGLHIDKGSSIWGDPFKCRYVFHR